MDNNKPALGQHQIGRGRGEVKGVRNAGGRKPWLLGDRRTDRQSCHEIESERIQEEAWLYGVPRCESCQPQGPTQRWTQ